MTRRKRRNHSSTKKSFRRAGPLVGRFTPEQVDGILRNSWAIYPGTEGRNPPELTVGFAGISKQPDDSPQSPVMGTTTVAGNLMAIRP